MSDVGERTERVLKILERKILGFNDLKKMAKKDLNVASLVDLSVSH